MTTTAIEKAMPMTPCGYSVGYTATLGLNFSDESLALMKRYYIVPVSETILEIDLRSYRDPDPIYPVTLRNVAEFLPKTEEMGESQDRIGDMLAFMERYLTLYHPELDLNDTVARRMICLFSVMSEGEIKELGITLPSVYAIWMNMS